MTAIQISCLGCAVHSFIVGYEMLGVSGFLKYGTFTLKVKIPWKAENGEDLRIVYNNIFYLSFPEMCFAEPVKLAAIMPFCNPLVIKSKIFLHD